MHLIIFEGPDQSGKTSTRKMVEKRMNFRDVGVDRFIGSCIVYGRVFNRFTKEQEAEFVEANLKLKNLNPVLIYLTAPIETIIERMNNTNHEVIDKTLLAKTIHEFDKYYVECPYDYKIKLDTSKRTQEQIVDLLVEYLSYLD